MPQLPKLSYVLLSHNREKYIRAAIESAFAQDYEGELEYIFSDDCSTDRTFEIIKECVAAYKGGRRVVVTQPPANRHLAGNTNHAVQFVESDWIVRADDDDLSSVDRCSIIGRAIAEHPGTSYVFTRMENFTDADAEAALLKAQSKRESIPQPKTLDVRAAGAPPPMQWFRRKLCLHQVWSTEHFRKFGPLPEDGYWVDDVMSFMRCCVLGTGLDIDVVTSYIRDGSGNMSRGGDDGERGYRAIMRMERFHDTYYNTVYSPLSATMGQVKEFLAAQPEATQQSHAAFLAAMEDFLQLRKWRCSYWRKGILNRVKICRRLGYSTAFTMLYSLPMPVYAGLLSLLRKLKGTR